MSNSLPTRCYMTRIEAFGVSVSGDPFADVQLIHPQGPTLYARAFESSFGDLNQLKAFERAVVNLQVTPTGLQLLPLADQVIPEPGDSIDSGDGQDQLEDPDDLESRLHLFPSRGRACRNALPLRNRHDADRSTSCRDGGAGVTG